MTVTWTDTNCLCIRMVMHMGIVAGLPCPGLEIRMDAAKTYGFFTLKETFNSFKIFFKIQGFPNKICKAIKKKLMNVFETGNLQSPDLRMDWSFRRKF